MLLTRIGYKKVSELQSTKHFAIYETHKGTQIVIYFASLFEKAFDEESFFYPKKDRLPYKDVEGKKICKGKLIFDSKIDLNIDLSKIINTNQIMCYKEFELSNRDEYKGYL